MASIKDYLKWRGDLRLCERPFNEVDNVVMATLAYLAFDGLVPEDTDVSLAQVLMQLLDASAGNLVPYVRSIAAIDAEFLTLVAESKRFGTALVRDYIDLVDHKRALQFSAYTAEMTDQVTVVAFRGTDHSLVGWRENFMLGFTVTEAQVRAAAYLRGALAQAARKGRRVVVCGHSKGGNLAAYAATVCPTELRGIIEHVWSDDGPGLAPEIMELSPRDALGARYTHIVPQQSVVGMLFDDALDEDVVVASSLTGVLQHDTTSWQVDVDRLSRTALASEARLVATTFANWLDGVDLATRETFVCELFDALAAGDPSRIDAVLASPAAMQRVISAIVATSSDTKGMAARLASVARTTATSAARTAARRAARAAFEAARETIAEAQAALRDLRGS